MSGLVYQNIATYKRSWHGMDNILTDEDRKDIGKVLKKANCDFRFISSPVEFPAVHPDGSRQQLTYPNRVVWYRNDNMFPCSITSSGFKVVQPYELFECYRDVVEHFGWKLSSAGNLKGGPVFWCAAEVPEDFVIPEEKTKKYVVLTSSVDRSLATFGYKTNIHTVCNNTLTAGISQAGENICKQTHRSEFDPDRMKRDLGIKLVDLEEVSNKENQLWLNFANTACTPEHLYEEYFNRKILRPAVAAPNATKESVEKAEKKFNKMIKKLVESATHGPGQRELECRRGTMWGALQGMTNYLDNVQGWDKTREYNNITLKNDEAKRDFIEFLEKV